MHTTDRDRALAAIDRVAGEGAGGPVGLMPRARRRWAVPLGTVLVLVVAACGGGGGGGTTTSSGTTLGTAANQNATGSPTKGGTLNLLGSSDVDHLDTASAYYTATYSVERAFARQLVQYPASTDLTTATTVVADVATQVPTKDNGGISSDGKTYTFKLRSGVKWYLPDSQQTRDVTAQDFVLGFKRLGNPASPVGAPQYFSGVIVGFKEFFDSFQKVSGTSVPDMKAFIQSHDISGITTPDSSTIIIKLVQPASDFLNIVALPFCSAAPVEYLNYVPDGNDFRTHTLSDGPYYISKYDANKEIDLAKNPAWSQSADSLRHQYVDAIKIVQGSDQGPVQQQLEAGTIDMQWDTYVPTTDVPRLKAANDARLGVFPGFDTNPYELFNLQSPNNGGALGKVAVRQALEYAIDKVAIAQVYGGPSLNQVLNQIIPPGNSGADPPAPAYETPSDKGDPNKCKSLLASAGYPNGFTLKDVYRNAGKHPAIFQVVQQDFAKCGVTIQGIPSTQGDYYSKYLENVNASKTGVWDLSEPGWVPDWFGSNNGRSIVEPLFDGRGYGPNSTDYGDYNSDAVNALIDKALSATSQDDANNFWHQAAIQILKDAPIVPFKTEKTPCFRSTRVHNAIFLPFSQEYDWTQVWLNQTS